MSDELSYRISNHHAFWIEDGEQKNVAYLSITRRHGILWMDNLSVQPKHRKKGLARELIEAAIAMYGHEDLYGRVYGYHDRPLDDEQLAAFYATFGFEPVPGAPGIIKRPASKPAHDRKEQP